MEIRYSKINNKTVQVKRRTFEGIHNPLANFHALTSKYMPSYKYYYEFTTINGIKHSNCTRTKQEAMQQIENYRLKEGKLL